MAQTPPNMDVTHAAPSHPESVGKDYPATTFGISRAFTNITAALALDSPSLAAFANAVHEQRPEAGEGVEVFPSPLCSAVTAHLVPLLQPVVFGSLSDRVFGSTAGLSARQQEQLKCFRRRTSSW
jgi:hypothetical protein